MIYPSTKEATHMHNEFTAVVEQEDDWFVAYCLEVPGANGQGKTVEECKQNLADAIASLLEDRREDMLRGLAENAQCEMITVE
jgi:predicted RNase H-like HicB family nuclease